MKRLTAILLALCLILVVTACSEEKAPQATEPAAQSTPLLYKVTDTDGDVVWLFGSIHLGRPDFYPLPDYVQAAYDSADSVGFEFDMIAYQSDMTLQVELMQGLMYLDGTTIKDHIPQQLYDDAVAAMTECGVYMSLMDHYQPVVWYSMLETAFMEKTGAQSDLGVDMHLLNMAYEDGKTVEELESAAFQMEMLGGLSEELQIHLLRETVALMDQVELGTALFDAMLDAWAQGDPELLLAAVSEDTENLEDGEAQLYAEFNDQLLAQRNLSMTDYAQAALEEGREVFICVGAAHIVGEGAMADLLAQRGYTVEVVTQ